MDTPEGARTFLTTGDAYDNFMGRYSRSLALPFADAAGVTSGHIVLDVGCGPGALTSELVRRVGAGHVRAFDPSPPFVSACSDRHPGVDVRVGRAEVIPFDDHSVDVAMAQLVLQFVSDHAVACSELRRVVRPGGVVAACVWDYRDGMEMLQQFWDASVAVVPDAPREVATMRFGGPGEIAELFEASDFTEIDETSLHVSSTYDDFTQLWNGFLAGIGPAGAFCVSLDDEVRADLRDEMFTRLGAPSGAISLRAVARCCTARA